MDSQRPSNPLVDALLQIAARHPYSKALSAAEACVVARNALDRATDEPKNARFAASFKGSLRTAADVLRRHGRNDLATDLVTVAIYLDADDQEPFAAEVNGKLEVIEPRAAEPPETVSGWVIEGAWSVTSQPDYWVGSSAWSTDPYKALRFATKKDAQQAADLMCSGMNVRICAHEWVEGTAVTKGEAL